MLVVPTIRGVANILAHVPHLVSYGSKPAREFQRNPSLRDRFIQMLRDYNKARDYLPNQAYIGNVEPDALALLKRPWWKYDGPAASRFGTLGEIMPEDEFFGLMRICDDFDLFLIERTFCADVRSHLERHPLIRPADLDKLGDGVAIDQITTRLNNGDGVPIHNRHGHVVACMLRDHPVDEALTAQVLLENLACKASGVLALRHLLWRDGAAVGAEAVDYLLGCGEEAVGDRYQRGGGSLGRAMGEAAGCSSSTGADLKAFCCSPVHGLVAAAAFVQAGLFRHVVVVGGGSLPKLAMKFQGHLAHGMPILEDVLGGVAVLIGPDDGRSPRIALDAVGRHTIGSGSSQQVIMESLVASPLTKRGLRFSEIDKYATELHNPDVTEPSSSGNIPLINYRMIAALAVARGEISRDQVDGFVRERGMPGF
ncbi:MAG: glycine/sarcosine/betaine reductase complex component C subunit beta, partial [Armatimonadota bacterium]